LKKQVLENSILNKLGNEIVTKNAESYKATRILYNKAILHVIRDLEWQNKAHSFDKEKAMREMETWEKKSVETVIEEVRETLNPKMTS